MKYFPFSLAARFWAFTRRDLCIWYAFRRGLATNLNRLGVDDSVIQRILRHSNVAVTQACYIKTASEDAKAAMQKLETALNDIYVTPLGQSVRSSYVSVRTTLGPFAA
jgi:hypothetical protein